MKENLVKFFVVLITAIIFVSANYAQKKNETQEIRKIEIQIQNTCREPVEKVVIKISGNAKTLKIKSNKSRKLLINLPFGNYQITAQKYGFKQTNVNDVVINKDSPQTINIYLEEGYASDDPKVREWKCPPLEKLNQ